MNKAEKLIHEITEAIAGSKRFKGMTDTDQKIEMGQNKNGMYFADLRDSDTNAIDSSTTQKTKAMVDKWLMEKGIKKIKWDDGKTTMLT